MSLDDRLSVDHQLIKECYQGHNINNVKHLICMGANVNYVYYWGDEKEDLYSMPEYDGMSPLSVAIYFEAPHEIIKELLNKGADVDDVVNYKSVLMMAAGMKKNGISIMKDLINRGADVNLVPSGEGDNIVMHLFKLYYIPTNDIQNIMYLLIDSGVNLDYENTYYNGDTDYTGATAGIIARNIIKGKVDVVFRNVYIEYFPDEYYLNNFYANVQKILDIIKEQIKAQKKAFYMSMILGDKLPHENNSSRGLYSGINFEPDIAKHIADFAFGITNEGAEESKSNKDAGSRRRKSKSKRRKSNRKKSKSKRRKKSRSKRK